MQIASWQIASISAQGLDGAGGWLAGVVQLQLLIFMQGLHGSQPEAITGDLQGAVMAQEMFGRWWAALRWCEAAAAILPHPPPRLLYKTFREHRHHLPLGLSSLPEASSPLGPPPAVGCAPLAWLYSMRLLSKQLKLAFVHLFNGSLPHVTLVRKRLHWLAQPSSWKPSSFWLDGFQPSVSPNRALGRVHGYLCLSAPTGGLGKK